MAKEKEQKTARILYVEQGKSAKEIAQLLHVTEKTISRWVTRYNWKSLQAAHLSAPQKRVENIKDIINDMAERRLEKVKALRLAEGDGNLEETETLRKEIAGLDDAVSKWNKTLANIDKENQLTLGAYLQVMERIFKALQQHDAHLYMQTIDFQEQHIQDVTINLG